MELPLAGWLAGFSLCAHFLCTPYAVALTYIICTMCINIIPGCEQNVLFTHRWVHGMHYSYYNNYAEYNHKGM